MKERFKERWNRTPSKKLTEQLRAEGAKYLSILNNATKADAIVKNKYNENRRAMDILCKSEVYALIYLKICLIDTTIKKAISCRISDGVFNLPVLSNPINLI